MAVFQNIRFRFRRMAFTLMLRIQPRLLPLFDRILKIAIVFFVLALTSLWIIRFPDPQDVPIEASSEEPPNVPVDIVLESPFRDLREPAPRPTPSVTTPSPINLTP